MDLEEIGINAGNSVDSARGRNYWRALVNAALNVRVPKSMELINYKYQKLYYNCHGEFDSIFVLIDTENLVLDNLYDTNL